jgi:eukaryotic-like serine/threonine-protein kinase
MSSNVWPPRLLANRYVIKGCIGRGGMGEVYEAKDRQLGRAVAVKLVDLSKQEDPRTGDSFVREARAAASLSHPNIVTVHDSGIDGDAAFMVMELLPGPTLDKVVHNEAPLPLDRVLVYIEQTAAGLAAAHEKNILHQDIKPSNLMLTATGAVKILDFGIAKVSESTQHTASQLMGSLHYMAPERFDRQPSTPQSDLYSLGCTLVTLLTGDPPFDGTSAEVLKQHLSDPPEPPSVRRPGIPLAVDDLVEQLLAKEPGMRPSCAEDVVSWVKTFRQTGTGTVMSVVDSTRPMPVTPLRVTMGITPKKRKLWTGRRAAIFLITLIVLAAVALGIDQVVAAGLGTAGQSPVTGISTPLGQTSTPPPVQTPSPTATPTPTPTPTPTATPVQTSAPTTDPSTVTPPAPSNQVLSLDDLATHDGNIWTGDDPPAPDKHKTIRGIDYNSYLISCFSGLSAYCSHNLNPPYYGIYWEFLVPQGFTQATGVVGLSDSSASTCRTGVKIVGAATRSYTIAGTAVQHFSVAVTPGQRLMFTFKFDDNSSNTDWPCYIEVANLQLAR